MMQSSRDHEDATWDTVADPGQIAAAVESTDIPTQVPASEQCNVDSVPGGDAVACQRTGPSLTINPRTRHGFLQIYGYLGIPMVIIFILSALWTVNLAVIQAAPTGAANYLMNTTNFDYGEFWLLPDPDDHIAIPAIVLLVLFGLGYVGLVVLMLFSDKLITSRSESREPMSRNHKQFSFFSRKTTLDLPDQEVKAKACNERSKVNALDAARSVAPVPVASRAKRASITIPKGFTWSRVKYEVTSPYGLVRHYYNPVLDLPKLIFQTTTLITYLHDGFPVAIICIYSCLLFVNWMISCYRYKRERPDPHFIVLRIFYSFDLFFAVFAPLEVLTYSYYNFNFDRDLFATKAETLNPGSFDRTARLYADPTEVSLFRIAFHYLQFSTVSSLAIKCALNLLSLFKWMRTIFHLVEHSRRTPLVVGAEVPWSRASVLTVQRRQYVQNLLIAAVFFCAGCSIFVYSMIAVGTSVQVCKSFPQCKVTSYRWNVGADQCSCIVFVDRSLSVATLTEWENPVDTTQNLAALASTGHLRIVQIINRALPELPLELRSCHDLEQLILVYTKTVAFPDWAKEFTHLEYLHIEGDLTPKQLTHLPTDLFDNMPHLTFLHLGSLVKLQRVPDLTKVVELRYLVLAMLHSVTELPSFDTLVNVKRLSLVDDILLWKLPKFRTLQKLENFALSSRSPVCCNGYMTAVCDLTDFQCKDRTASGEPLVQCTSQRIAEEDLAVLTHAKGTVCDKVLTFDLKNTGPTAAMTDVACGGVTYKQCTINNVIGMCYPSRMQVIGCQQQVLYQKMRRLQIARGVGDPCDPVIEAWLGCAAT